MTCQDCVNQETDFIDDALTPLERARHASHLERCTSCARYHRVLARGLQLVRDMPEIQPSPGFRGTLHRRLRAVQDDRIRRERAVLSGATAAIALAGLIALAAWAPVWQEAVQRRHTEVAARDQLATVPTVELPPGQWWYDGPGGEGSTPLVHRVSTFPGPYSPLVVQPPAVSTPGTTPAYSDGE